MPRAPLGAERWSVNQYLCGYERLLGEPSFFPHDTEAVWTLGENRSVYAVQDPDRAGHGLVTVFVEDLDGRLDEIAARGLEPDKRETYATACAR